MFVKFKTPAVLAAYFALAFIAGTTALAAGTAVADNASLTELLGPVWDAITGKHWWLAAAVGLVAGVTLFKRYAPEGKAREFANSDEGGAALVLAGAFGGALAASLSGATPVPMSGALAYDAFRVSLEAAGGYVIIAKLLIGPMMRSAWYQNKAPGWLKAGLSVVTWMFAKSSPALKKADEAGNAAVAANPPAGTDKIAPATEV